MAEHRIEFVQVMHAFGDLVGTDAQFVGQCVLLRVVVGQEFVEWRIEQADGRGQALERLENADEVFALIGEELGEGRLTVLLFLREDHFAHRIDAVAFEKHVFRTAKSDTARPKSNCIGRLLGRVGIGPDPHAGGLAAPGHELREVLVDSALRRAEGLLDEHLDDFRGRGLDLTIVDFAGRAIDREVIPLVVGLVADFQGFVVVVDVQGSGAADADLAHLTGDQRGMRTYSAPRGQDAFRRDHAAQVLR